MLPDAEAARLAAIAANEAGYPRPQLVRSQWKDLTGTWRFALDDDEVGVAAGWWSRNHRLPGSIVVPFPPESAASGVEVDGIHDVVWYQRDLTPDDIHEAGFRAGVRDRVVLHFGAVDYRATVWVDGQEVGSHEGGHTPFSIVLPVLDPEGEHVVTVRAEDRAADVGQPRGKQDWRPEPHVIWYRRTTGIWQPVWLEATPALAIEKIHWTADVAAATVRCEIRLSAPPSPGNVTVIDIAVGGEVLAGVRVAALAQRFDVTVDLPGLKNGQALDELLWTPESPTLIDAVVSIGEDSVASYFGIRSASVGGGWFLLNDRPLYLRSVLSQGYWPTSHLAAPTPTALREEVEWILKLGFNAARIHQKTEDPRFLYWADRLGLLVWGEAAAAFEYSTVSLERTTREWLEILDRDRSHPSIVTWVPLNESWGVQQIAREPAQADFARALVALTRAIDPTRPVISNDGWEHVESDIFTVHDYDFDEDVLAARYGGTDVRQRLLAGPGPAGRRLSVSGARFEDAPLMVTEFGGIDYSPGAAAEDAWGYSSATSADDFAARIGAVYRGLAASDVVVGSCYTQLTDTLQETNGLLTDQRIPKLDIATIRAIVRGDDR